MVTEKSRSPMSSAQSTALWDIIDTLDLGFGVFDADLQLIDWNPLFQKIRNYPENLCRSGVGLQELLAHDQITGQLLFDGSDDPVASWIMRAQARNGYSGEQALKGGRILSMTLKPTGRDRLVLLFRDITTQSRNERALQSNQQWYDLVSEASSEGIYDWNIRTNELKVTYRLTAMLGLSPGDLNSHDWTERIHPEDFDNYRGELVRHFKGETPLLKTEYRVRRKSGDYIWFSDSGKCIRDKDGRATRLVGAIADVTKHKLADAALKKSEERYAIAMQAIDEGVYDWDIETGDIYYSTDVRSALGLDPGQLKTADDWFTRIHSDDQPKWRNALVDHLKGRTERFDCEFRYLGGDGRWRWARQQGIARFNDRGRAVRMIGASGDITELIEHRLAASEARTQLSKAVDTISDGFAIYDAEDRLVLCNRQYQALYPGLEDILIPGARYEDILRTLADRQVLADIGDNVEAWVRSRMEQRRKATGSYHAQLTDGRWTNVSWRRTRDGGLVGVFTDITELKTAEIKLGESEERYALATAAATEGLYDWNVASDELLVSPRLNAIMSLPIGSLSSSEWNDRIYPRDRDKYRAAMRAHFMSNAPHFSTEYRIRTGEGDYIWVEDNSTSVRIGDGRVIRLVGAIKDISVTKNAEQALREAKQRAETANQLAIDKAKALETLSTKLSKYLSPQVYSSIFTGERSVEIDAKRKKLTIFFSDIAGFTNIVDTLESEEVTSMLNEYLTEMSSIALQFGATIDKFIGDAMLVFFGDPGTKGPKQDAVACVKMGIAMQRRLRELQHSWRNMGVEKGFELRIGITTGFCTVGNFGSEDRMDYTVVGNEVNLAARLQSHAETGGILLSSETHALVKDEILAEEQGYVSLKGISRPIRALKVVGIYDELADAGQIVRVERPGIQLLVNPANLSVEEKADVLGALQEAARKIQQIQS